MLLWMGELSPEHNIEDSQEVSINAKKCLFWFDDLRAPLSIEPSG